MLKQGSILVAIVLEINDFVKIGFLFDKDQIFER
jgi:hypothetical protein